jgi:hypothetical protein
MEGFKVEEVKRSIYIYKKKRRGGEVAKSSRSLRWKEAGSNKTCTTFPLLNSAGSRAAVLLTQHSRVLHSNNLRSGGE